MSEDRGCRRMRLSYTGKRECTRAPKYHRTLDPACILALIVMAIEISKYEYSTHLRVSVYSLSVPADWLSESRTRNEPSGRSRMTAFTVSLTYKVQLFLICNK